MSSFNRIISLVPSLTEFIVDLGLADQLAGRTRFCIRPEEVVKGIPIIGGTKNPQVDKILEMDPDCIITNREENREEDVRELQEKSNAHIEITDIPTIREALETMLRLGILLNSKEKAEQLVEKIKEKFHQRPVRESLRTVYFIWKEPWMTIGGDTYIHDVMKHWNLENIFGRQNDTPR